MRFLEYLFFKYYQLQLKVGNNNNTTTVAITSLLATFTLYFFDAIWYVFILSNYAKEGCINGKFVLILFLILVFSVWIALELLFGIRGKDKIVIQKHEQEWKGKKNAGVIVFSAIPFMALLIELYLISITKF